MKSERTALVRVEQIYPNPMKQIAAIIKSYPNVKNIVWCQEEPKNMGSWGHIYFCLQEMIESEGCKVKLKYVGRPERSSPATGSVYRHKVEQAQIVSDCLKV